MKVLIDNCLPVQFRDHLPGHDVETAAYRGWGELENGELVDAAVAAGFDAIVSIDQGQQFASAVGGKSIAAVLLPGHQGNRIEDVAPLAPSVLAALPTARPGEVTRI